MYVLDGQIHIFNKQLMIFFAYMFGSHLKAIQKPSEHKPFIVGFLSGLGRDSREKKAPEAAYYCIMYVCKCNCKVNTSELAVFVPPFILLEK